MLVTLSEWNCMPFKEITHRRKKNAKNTNVKARTVAQYGTERTIKRP
jgi:hypothetical protein